MVCHFLSRAYIQCYPNSFAIDFARVLAITVWIGESPSRCRHRITHWLTTFMIGVTIEIVLDAVYDRAQRLRWLLRPFWVAVRLPTGLRVRILLITCYPRHVTRNTG
jgi:hypothetical protein